MLPQGPAARIIVPPNVEILAFLASFRAILAVFGTDFAPLGRFGPFLGPFGPFWSLFDPLSLVASSPWWQARVQSELVYLFQGVLTQFSVKNCLLGKSAFSAALVG